MSTSTTSSGHCLCGGVEYSVTGTQGPNLLCFCSNCQIAGGSAFSWVQFFSDASLEAQKGEDLMRKYEDRATASGNMLERWFCSKCGSQLFAKSASGLTILHVGSMDGGKHEPTHGYWQHNRPTWAIELDDFKSH